MTITIIVLIITIAMFIWGRVRGDIVALSSLMVLTATGVLTTSEALSGFSSPILIFHIILLLPCVFGSSSGYVRVLLFHDVIFARSQHSHIVVFSCSVPCFSHLCPIIVR